MTEWQFRLPYDFSEKGRGDYEAAGWERKSEFHLVYKNRQVKFWFPRSLAPVGKFGTRVQYKNTRLDLIVNTIDCFDQGVVYMEWYRISDIVSGAERTRGRALYVNCKWVIQKAGEVFRLTARTMKRTRGRSVPKIISCGFYRLYPIFKTKRLIIGIGIERKN